MYVLTLTEAELGTLPAELRARAKRRAKRKSTVGQYRSVLVTFADGEQRRGGAYELDDTVVKSKAIRFAKFAYAYERIRAGEAPHERTYGAAFVAKLEQVRVPNVVSAELVR